MNTYLSGKCVWNACKCWIAALDYRAGLQFRLTRDCNPVQDDSASCLTGTALLVQVTGAFYARNCTALQMRNHADWRHQASSI